MQKMVLHVQEFVKYKFLNSLFLGMSVGTVFVLYEPLPPSVYSLGGIVLALGMLIIAKFYYKILNIPAFFKVSLSVEIVLLGVIAYFLIFSYSYMSAMTVYIGYQLTFVFGAYLVRAETLFLKNTENITQVDVAKQKGYLTGMFFSYISYQTMKYVFGIDDKHTQVYVIHFALFILECLIIYMLIHSFGNEKAQNAQ